MRDLDRIALGLPGADKSEEDGRPTYSVNGKYFCFHRRPRPDALDERGERLTDVLVFRVDGQETKELVLADPRGIFFTTPHWNGYPAVLLRRRDLKQLKVAELRDTLVDAWLTRVSKKVAREWLEQNG
ncbi:MAG TPA: hypothetical protein VHD91_11340 [Gaiellaceae bacterium]|nr:hypothetical protein [Gaiellaceae bacterium]